MNAAAMRRMYAYHHWANARVWACVESLSDEQFTQEHAYSIGSVHNQVYHLMVSELYTLSILGEDHYDEYQALKQEDFPTRAAIRQQWDSYNDRLDAGLAALTDAALTEPVVLRSSQGSLPAAVRWEFLYAMVNHAANHRAQILALIHQLGGETCEQDFFFFMLEN